MPVTRGDKIDLGLRGFGLRLSYFQNFTVEYNQYDEPITITAFGHV
jgi:hypothetical protein